jgi:hypothetical protein
MGWRGVQRPKMRHRHQRVPQPRHCARHPGCPVTLPGTVEALFRRANELAFAENHAAALEVYGALGDVGIVDPDVEQNIAVCHARLGDLPRAIFHFERALCCARATRRGDGAGGRRRRARTGPRR